MSEYDYTKWRINWNIDDKNTNEVKYDNSELHINWNIQESNTEVKADTEIQEEDIHFTNLFDHYSIRSTKPETDLELNYTDNDAYTDRTVELPPQDNNNNEKCIDTLHNLNHDKNIVLFGLSKCSHCNKMNELIQNSIENKWANIVEQNDVNYVHNFMDTDKCYKTAEFYNIEHVPYILLLKGKNIVKVIDPIVYKTNKDRLLQIEKFIQSNN